MAKLRSLHMKRTESRTLNHREVVEEDRRNKEPKNMEARKKRAEYVLKEVSRVQVNRDDSFGVVWFRPGLLMMTISMIKQAS